VSTNDFKLLAGGIFDVLTGQLLIVTNALYFAVLRRQPLR
jgi:hypothetical protein